MTTKRKTKRGSGPTTGLKTTRQILKAAPLPYLKNLYKDCKEIEWSLNYCGAGADPIHRRKNRELLKMVQEEFRSRDLKLPRY